VEAEVMSGAALSGEGRSGLDPFERDIEPRRPFGRRPVRAELVCGRHGFDVEVFRLRQRIGAAGGGLPTRLPYAVSVGVIAGLSAALWLDAFAVARALAPQLASLF
jgi:hypothetical protein